MSWDYFSQLAQQESVEHTPLPWGYASGWVDHCAVRVAFLEIQHAIAKAQNDSERAKNLRKHIVEIQEEYRKWAEQHIPLDFCDHLSSRCRSIT